MLKEKNYNQKYQIWIVEDNDLYRKNLLDLINEQSELGCSQTFNCSEDIILAFHKEWAPDVVLLDIGLPGISGLECIPQLKALSPGTHIILITIYDDDEKIFKAICAGASGYLLKSSPEEKIIEAIHEVINGGASMNSYVAKKIIDMFAKINLPKQDYRLSSREKEILEHIVNGLTKKKIAEKLFLSFHTIDTHLRSIYNKLHVNSRSSAVAKILKENLL